VLWCPRYRRQVITDDVDERLKQIIRDVRARRHAPVVEREMMPDHGRLLVVCDPHDGIHRLARQIKGRSSRLGWQEFPQLRRRLPALWTNSYFAATVGGATLEVVNRYAENQRNVQATSPLPPHAEARGFAGGF
jgi:putative transposase